MTSAEPGGRSGPSAVNVPNGLTLLRLALVPVFVVLLVSNTNASRIAAFIVFGVASVTDLLDGELARRHGLITDFGKIADPIADKALTGSALITLSALSELSWWVTGVIMVREVGVTILRLWVIRHGVIPASRGGKIKTVVQIVAIGLYILPLAIGPARITLMAVAVVVTLVTGGDYVHRAFQLRRMPPLAGRPAAGNQDRPDSGDQDRSAAGDQDRPADGIAAELGGRPRGGPVTTAGDDTLAAQVVGLLTARELTVGTAESLTGGLIAATLTAVPGASAVFLGAVVAYSAELKARLLDVPEPLLRRVGTVHQDVALAMASGARRRLGVDLAVAVTGVAGPDPVGALPPGTVHVAVSAPCGERHAQLCLEGNRARIRDDTVLHALRLLRAALSEDNP